VRFMAVDNYKTWAYCAYYPRMVHLGSIWDIQVKSLNGILVIHIKEI